MRVLVITKIFPNAKEPTSATFNRQQLAALAQHCDVEVLATIPYFPGASLFGARTRAASLSTVPYRERIDGLAVEHPRYLYLPAVPLLGDALAEPLYVASLLRSAIARRGTFDVILGAWAFPDGCAAVDIGRLLNVPVAMKLHGSDINVLGERAAVRPWLCRGLRRADAIVAVSTALADRAKQLGARAERTFVVRNGVDPSLFHPRSREEARRKLDLPVDAPLVVAIGRPSQQKGSFELLDAIAQMPDDRIILAMVGEGPAAMELRKRGERLGRRLVMPGDVAHRDVATWMAAADVVALPSWNEGTPNVVLEALASGRRVVATRVGGIPDVVDERVGTLVAPRDVEGLRRALASELATSYAPEEVARRAAIPSWQESARALFDVLGGVARC